MTSWTWRAHADAALGPRGLPSGEYDAFEEAAAHLAEELGVAVSGETVRRVSEAVGAVAEAEQ